MSIETVMTEEQLIRQATDTLIDNLGIMEATRFLTIKRQGHFDSVERHKLWQNGLNKEDFFDNGVFTRTRAGT